MASRTTPSSGSIVFVSQAYAAHAHQSTPSTTSPRRARPGRVGDDEPGDLREREDEDQVEEQLERSDALLAVTRVRAGIEQAYPRGMSVPPTIRAAAWAAVLSGAPSTLHALATGRDPLEAALAAGSIVLPRETRPAGCSPLPSPFISRSRSAGRWRSTAPACEAQGEERSPGFAIGVVDLSLAARVLPRIRALPVLPQLADHAAYRRGRRARARAATAGRA